MPRIAIGLRLLGFAASVLICLPAPAAVPRARVSTLSSLVVADPSSLLGAIAEQPEQIGESAASAPQWSSFRSEGGDQWTTWLDRRSGVPLLVMGRSAGWFFPVKGADSRSILAGLEERVRGYIASHEKLFRIDERELELNVAASGPIDLNHWLVEFDRRKAGVRIEGEHVAFYFSDGNLVAFGADRWGTIDTPSTPSIDADGARALLDWHALAASSTGSEVAPAELIYVAVLPDPVAAAPGGVVDRAYRGTVGKGVQYRLAWKLTRRYDGETGTWVGKIDAHTGNILAFYDDAQYAQAVGGVFPISNDQICPDGCEQPGWPMPYADITTPSGSSTATSTGQFNCSPAGGTATTHLAGPYVRVSDQCGPVDESVTCDTDLDLGTFPGTDCDIAPGASAGNTHSSRSGFYHLNRMMEKGRAWLPANNWLTSQLVDNVNIDQTCNAYWDNFSVNFFKSGGGCRNTGEIAGVFVHEWGHGLDYNDGGGYDNPSEAYADAVAMLQSHQSCMGRGFFLGQNCGGYGDACLDCTGVRDHDYDMHASHAPVTPSGYIASNCPAGDGPCGKEVHCEGYIAGETLWDFASRDLPAHGLTPASAWQTADRLFYLSRQGSGGNAYNCALPSSDGCNVGSWFTKFRTIDDDDGNLANGTPHAAAIYAAFARHGIACGSAGDPSNQDSSSCPALSAPVLNVTAAAGTASLSWNAVAGATHYLILRNDDGCAAGHTIIATVSAPSTSYTDTGLADGFEEHYAVQARSANSACLSALSNCVSIAPQPTAGAIKLDRQIYNCASTIQIRVLDSNVGAPSVTARIASGVELAYETVLLTETPPGSARFIGTIGSTTGPAVQGDGLLSIMGGTLLNAQYTDANDGLGGTNLVRQTTATVDCVAPHISGVIATDITDTSATIHWTTDETGDSRVIWGASPPPGSTTLQSAPGTIHDVALDGLVPCTRYFFSVGSQDAGGNTALDNAGGAFYQFQTSSTEGVACRLGSIRLDRNPYGCGDIVGIAVGDVDLNLDPGTVDAVTVTLTSTSEATPETVVLTETDVDTGFFFGTIPTGPLPVAAADGILEIEDSDVITATYRDRDTGLGGAGIATQHSLADCAAPVISGITVTSIGDDSAVIEWTTSEDSVGYVEFGPTAALGGYVDESFIDPLSPHSAYLYPIVECERVYFRIGAYDFLGNFSSADNGGSNYQFNAWTLPGAIYKQDFEGTHGWVLQGEWQVAAPQGLGSDYPDPTSAEHGTKVLGLDLTGLGAHPGDYEPGVTASATSPFIDATQLRHGQLKFRQWLNAEYGATAKVQVWGDNPHDMWSSDAHFGWYDSEWQVVTLDISEQADDNDRLRIAFSQYGGPPGSTSESSWNIDRIEIRDATITTPVVCGGCTGTPSFAGLSSADDVDGCAATGVLLSWGQAAAWGSGGPGTYAVYRSTSATFVPSAATLVASGLTATSYADTALPSGATVYYIVRAESGETCSSGPFNHGVVDGNLARRNARDSIQQPDPGAVGSSLRLGTVNSAHVRLTWGAAPDSSSYHVLRGATPGGPFTLVDDVHSLLFDDLDALTVGGSSYYLVKAADSCGNEGP